MPADVPPDDRGRRRRLLRGLATTLGLLAFAIALNTGVGALASALEGDDEPEAAIDLDDPDLVTRGRDVFGSQCALCHGETARGTEDGPSLLGVGPASVDFMIRTGRMPMDNPGQPLTRGPQKLSDADRRAVVAYVHSLAPGEGPAIPDISGFEHADISEGLKLFTTNCAACHGPTAAGIAVGQRDVSSTLDVTSPIAVAEAIRTGPGVMPVFSEEVMSEEEVEAVVAWVERLKERPAPGGLQIGRSGPVSEGFVAWVVGIGLLTIAMYLLGEKASDDPEEG